LRGGSFQVKQLAIHHSDKIGNDYALSSPNRTGGEEGGAAPSLVMGGVARPQLG